jgi:hypothetical protein
MIAVCEVAILLVAAAVDDEDGRVRYVRVSDAIRLCISMYTKH